MRRFLLSLLVGLAACAARGEEAPLRFERRTGETNGVAAAFQAWHREEMERQGGPGKSHGWWLWGLRALDFDNDGVLDLLASHHGVPHSMLLRGSIAEDGTLLFADVTKSLGIDHRDLPGADDRPWIWDFDGDGRLDLAGFSDEAKPNCLLNVDGRRFEVITGFSFAPLSHPREVVDLDGDGDLDLDGGRKGRWLYDPQRKTFRHDAQPRFAVPEDVPNELLAALRELQQSNRGFQVDALTHDVVGYDTLGYYPEPIDLDGDDENDVVLVGSGGYGAPYRGRYLLRQSDGRLVDRTAALRLPENGAPIVLRDLTGDGLPEVLVVADKAGTDGGGFFLNEGGGSFRRLDGPLSQFLDRRGPYLLRAYQADFNDDGLPELVLSNPRLGRTVVFQNHGAGRFTESLSLGNCWDSNPIAVHDFDRDGRLDLAIGLRPEKDSPGDIHLFLNRTEQAGRYLNVSPRMTGPNPFAVGAVVEIYPAGESAKSAVRPLLIEKAHPDGSPVHVGLGDRMTCDVRVRFPSGAEVVREHVPSNQHVTIAP